MTKVSRREAVGTLLGGFGCLVGTYLLGFKMPDFPEECRRDYHLQSWCRHIDGICQGYGPGATAPPVEPAVKENYSRRNRATRQ
jgi:hypothetical protein